MAGFASSTNVLNELDLSVALSPLTFQAQILRFPDSGLILGFCLVTVFYSSTTPSECKLT